MKLIWKPVIYALIAVLLFMNAPQKVDASVSVSAKSAILMEQKSGRVLFEKDAHKVRRIASITKIMTAILAIESGKMDEEVKVSGRAIKAEGSSVYLKEGEKIKLEHLVYGLMLRSGNDTAVAIAEHVGGSVEGFVYLMNQKAQEIGMTKTHFSNPHGLDDHEQHYSTAYDMALLTRYTMNNETYKKIAGSKLHRAPNPTEKWDRVWKNKNRLLNKYQYCTGGKTGYTKRAKRTLVTTATKGDMDLIAVTLNGPDDWNDHIFMFENGFKKYDMAEIAEEGKISAGKSSFYKNKIYINHPIQYPVTSKESKKIKLEYKLLKPKEEWDDEEDVPSVVGNAVVYIDGREIEKVPVYFEKSSEDKKSLFEFFDNIFTSMIGIKSDG
ncbi:MULTISPECIES: D-alanyl-D-alanine carboxypeptidase family protein [unclassified Bacillus (in: firmicutes)]|uniref:D-alanyl-D-alanine carboxypeptidase family protein n=1 Tax=unclassified Bacillus (in: firmicutes) TaxID=185979 RepID=UPI0008E88490|nr:MULTISPECIES: D-alanyl-D-alanine carboxypeptidase family protein [unclassified Bacillus (in: firmicutes)]SFA97967.1 D-alanyl-D-alanine carboxypeptidase [Bacillus sp. UNCCL13]SFQ80748.1 D-alanyl-D-alanine carboxypeptidase [Bacillus sp. cl95]